MRSHFSRFRRQFSNSFLSRRNRRSRRHHVADSALVERLEDRALLSTDPLVLSFDGITELPEGDGSYTHKAILTRSGGDLSQSLIVNVADLGGDADSPKDYRLRSQTVKFRRNRTTTKVKIRIKDDSRIESTESFTIEASINGVSVAQTFQILDDDGPSNTAPVAISETLSVLHGASFADQVTATDAENDPLQFALISNPSSGTLDLDPDFQNNGQYTYSADPAFAGQVTFDFAVSDGLEDSIGTITVDVTNTSPVAASETISVVHGATVNGQVTATDADNDILQYFLLDNPASGMLIPDGNFQSNGQFTYTADPFVTGPVTFDFVAFDGITDSVGTITFDVTNTAPVAVSETISVVHGATVNGQVTATDADNDILQYFLLDNPASGMLIPDGNFQSNGQFTYTADPFVTGPVTFDFVAFDGITDSVGTITFDVTNTAPVAVSETISVVHGATVNGQVTATDADNDILQYFLLDNPTSGILIPDGNFQSNGQFTYTADPFVTGPVTFDFVAFDGITDSVGTITFDVTNTAPVAVSETISVIHGATVNGQVTATDADNDVLQYFLLDNPTSGILIPDGNFQSNGQFTYTADPFVTGPVTFDFVAFDGITDSVGTITFDVTNTAPVAVSETISVIHGATVNGQVTATDADNDVLQYFLLDNPTSGILIPDGNFQSNGQFTYTADPFVTGPVTFDFVAFDGITDSVGTITFDVTNTAPVAVSETISVVHGATVNGQVTATDADNDVLQFQINQYPTNGTFQPDPNFWQNGQFTYTADPQFTGQTSFEFLVFDGIESSTATITIDVTNTPPVTVSETLNLTLGESLQGQVQATDADNDVLQFEILEWPQVGMFDPDPQFWNNGQFTYTADPFFTGQVTFVFAAFDGVEQTIGTITFEITD